MSDGYAVTLPVAGERVLVVGAGGAALAHVAALRDAGARIVVVAPSAEASIADLAERHLVTWHARTYQASDLDGVRLVVAATGEADEGIRQDADAQGLWCVTAERASARHSGGTVVLVGGGPGDPGLLTQAGVDALRTADVVVTDRLAPLAALSVVPPGAEVVDVAKIPHGRATAQQDINRVLVDRARSGQRVVRLKGGDAFVFGRGGEELQACSEAGIPVEVVPGVSSAIAGPALAGIPVTHRGLSQGFCVVSGHLPPDDPGCTVDYAALATSGLGIVLLMAVKNLPAIATALVDAGLPADTPAAMIADATLPSQRITRASVATIAERAVQDGLRAPAITVVGAVAGFDA